MNRSEHSTPSRFMLAIMAPALLALAGGSFRQAGAQEVTAEPPPPSTEALADRRVVLVTGSTSGLGRELALTLGGRGDHVIVHGRNRERGLEVVDRIRTGGQGTASFYAADLASLAEVRALGEAVLRDYERVDILVNNAGIWLRGDDTRRTSADGMELSFAVNYVSGVLLTRMLLPIIPQSPDSHVINVASVAQTPIDFDDPMLEDDYSGGRAYGQSKLAQVMFTFDLAEDLAGTGIKVNSLHPASLMDTRMVRSAGVTPRTTVEEGLEAVLNLIDSPDVGSGGYYDGLEPARANAQAYDDQARSALRRLTEELIAQEGWSVVGSMPFERGQAAAAAWDGRIYVVSGAAGGEDATGLLQSYDPGTGEWRDLSPMPDVASHAGAAARDGAIYVVGGFVANVHVGAMGRVFEYDVASDSWRSLPPLGVARGAPGVVVLDGRIHAVGGRNDEGPVDAHEVYDPATGEWSEAAPLPVARDHLGAVAANGRIHVFGGRTGGSSDNTGRHDIYDPVSDTWTEGASMPTPRSGGVAFQRGGVLVYAGGECRADPRSTYSEVEGYDVEQGAWVELPPLPMGLHAGVGVGLDGTAYLLGGRHGCGGDGPTLDVLRW